MRRLFACLLAAGLLARAGDRPAAAADDAGDVERRAQVVATLGAGPTMRSITVGELEDRVAAMPPFQRATFGDTPSAVRRKFLSDVLVPEVLLAMGGADAKLDQQLPTSYGVERARSQATVRALRDRIGPAAAIPMQDVQKYYDDNRARYDTPERYQLWRILCKTREEAVAVVAAAKKEPTPKEFGELAREHSIDKATFLRAGNLGFVSADGASNEPGLRVDPSIVHAAQAVHDGDIVPSPVPEGDGFAVVWRRGTIAANKRTVEDAAAQIRDALWKARVEKGTHDLLDGLRSAKLRDVHEELLDTLEVPSGDAGVIGVHRPAAPAVSH
jgi:peptidyl-prolyl cis-trans isomerase C